MAAVSGYLHTSLQLHVAQQPKEDLFQVVCLNKTALMLRTARKQAAILLPADILSVSDASKMKGR